MKHIECSVFIEESLLKGSTQFRWVARGLIERAMLDIENDPDLHRYAHIGADEERIRATLADTILRAATDGEAKAKLSSAGDRVGASLLHRFAVTARPGRYKIYWRIELSEGGPHERAD